MIDYKTLHDLSYMNEYLIKQVKHCGCYYCMNIFKSSEIENWVNDGESRTAICPYCCIDSVLQESIDKTYELSYDLLKKMNDIFFNGHSI